MSASVLVIGGGLAGSEAAWVLAQRGIDVTLCEMRPGRMTPAHRTGALGELVCSNSLRSDDPERNAVGVLHEELRRAGSLILATADRHRVPAGGALAVDREAFSAAVTAQVEAHPRITLERREVTRLDPGRPTIIASGPLTSDALFAHLEGCIGAGKLYFFDAIAPIVARDSIDFSVAWMQSRYDKGSGDDYINCPMDRAQYEEFIDALLAAEKMAFKSFEACPWFEGCMPIEVMAERGRETPRHGPMKPVGLTNPHQPDVKPYAVVQLRRDNAAGTLWNMVGFQTKMTWPEQRRVFSRIPGLTQAEFVRLGALHRNTFINSPTLLDDTLRLRSQPSWRFAGQITGVEGYVESTAMGLLAGLFLAGELQGHPVALPPVECALGALLAHITREARPQGFQPMNIHFGLMPPPPRAYPQIRAQSRPGRPGPRRFCQLVGATPRSWGGETLTGIPFTRGDAALPARGCRDSRRGINLLGAQRQQTNLHLKIHDNSQKT
ncbi:MAG: methylenetetrahydrofolate--tRNA-(uracil(54)-C(5))-methyltransferase (FADH(2)-oxidizing) TrmFO [Magnetococcus sp. WYHC-3]